MATETVHYKLVKPGTEDFYNVSDFNSNMDVIDAEMKGNGERLGRMAGSKRVSLTAAA